MPTITKHSHRYSTISTWRPSLAFACLLIALQCVLATGCGTRITSAGTVLPIRGQVKNAAGDAIGNVLLVLQPLEQGYVTELEVDSQGSFSGEAIQGKYVFYFVPSKAGKKKELPKQVPASYRDAKIEHAVTIVSGEDIVCSVE